MLIHTGNPDSLSWPCSRMDEFDFDFVWADYYLQPACRACEQWMPNGTNKCAWCQLSGVAWQWEATGFCLFCGCKRCDKRGLTGVGVEMEDWRMRGWMTGSLNGGEGGGAWCCWGRNVFILSFLYLQWHENEMHVRGMVREWQEEGRDETNVTCMFSQTYEPVLCMCSVCPLPDSMDRHLTKRCSNLSTCVLGKLSQELHKLQTFPRTNVGAGTPGKKRSAPESDSYANYGETFDSI